MKLLLNLRILSKQLSLTVLHGGTTTGAVAFRLGKPLRPNKTLQVIRRQAADLTYNDLILDAFDEAVHPVEV